jgi:hypothetical protein
MNNSDHISESLETIFWVKILKFFVAYPGWKKFGSGMEKFGSGVRDKHPGSEILLLFSLHPFRPSACTGKLLREK